MKYLAIQGCPRSGTGLLASLMDSHDQIRVTREEMTFIKSSKLKNINNCFNKEYYCDKLPKYYLHNLNDVKRIHVSRNPLNTINSMLDRTRKAKKGKDDSWSPFLSVRDACYEWIIAWEYIVRNNDNSNVLHIKYESLVNNTKKELQRITKFLNLQNNFDAPIVNNGQKEISLTREERVIINRYLGKIIDNWDFSLNYLINNFSTLKRPESFFKIKYKNALWEVYRRVRKWIKK